MDAQLHGDFCFVFTNKHTNEQREIQADDYEIALEILKDEVGNDAEDVWICNNNEGEFLGD